MQKTTTVAQYLIDKLKKEGVYDIFGIPGDYVIRFFGELEKCGDFNIITTCSEQGAAFAADAYSRMNGLGVLCVTYCVGGLNTVNAVAGAYAEKAPLIVISGAPGLSERHNKYLLHHSVRDLNSQYNIFKELTVASCQLEDAATAPYEIDRVIGACIEHKRPVYIELPRDMLDAKCAVPSYHPISPNKKDENTFQEAINEALAMFKLAKQPVIIGGEEIRRYKLEEIFTGLLEKAGCPYATTILGKSIIDESHPQFIGVYMGRLGDEEVRDYIEHSDCIFILGALNTDTNLGTAQFDLSKTIFAAHDTLRIKHHFYNNIDLGEFINSLSEQLVNNEIRNSFKHKEPICFEVQPDAAISVKRFFERLNSFVKENSVVVCDVGDSLFGSVDIKIPKGSSYLGPAYYTSMGYAIPAGIGVSIRRPDMKPVIIVGDGAFQMTGYELSCYVKYKLKPTIFVLNNKGYTTQRYLQEGEFNNIQDWNYHMLPIIFGGGLGIEVSTEAELEEALTKADMNDSSFTLINVHMDKFDKSPTLYRFTQVLSEKIHT